MQRGNEANNPGARLIIRQMQMSKKKEGTNKEETLAEASHVASFRVQADSIL
jgi:hypothetical protein